MYFYQFLSNVDRRNDYCRNHLQPKMTMETDEIIDNTDNLSKNAVKLQEDLGKLKLEIIKAKAQRKAEQSANTTTNNLVDDVGDLYGPDASKASDELHRVTRERTQTFLNFTNLQAALKASQANKAITRAFNLDGDGKINLEKEEAEHVRSLLEDQKELTMEVIRQHEEGVAQELEIIKARLELAHLHSRYAELKLLNYRCFLNQNVMQVF